MILARWAPRRFQGLRHDRRVQSSPLASTAIAANDRLGTFSQLKPSCLTAIGCFAAITVLKAEHQTAMQAQ